MKNAVWVIIGIVFIFTVAHVMLNKDKNKGMLSASSLQASLGGDKGFHVRQELTYDTINEKLPDGMTKSVSKVVSPVGAQISVTAASADTVTVQKMWQEGDNTFIVLRPTSDKNQPEKPQ